MTYHLQCRHENIVKFFFIYSIIEMYIKALRTAIPDNITRCLSFNTNAVIYLSFIFYNKLNIDVFFQTTQYINLVWFLFSQIDNNLNGIR